MYLVLAEMNLQDEKPVDSACFYWQVPMDIDEQAVVAEPKSASGACPVEDNPWIDLQYMLEKNLVLARHSYLKENLNCSFLIAAYLESCLSEHSSQKLV